MRSLMRLIDACNACCTDMCRFTTLLILSDTNNRLVNDSIDRFSYSKVLNNHNNLDRAQSFNRTPFIKARQLFQQICCFSTSAISSLDILLQVLFGYIPYFKFAWLLGTKAVEYQEEKYGFQDKVLFHKKIKSFRRSYLWESVSFFGKLSRK